MNDGCGEENIQKIIILILYGYRDNVGIGKERGLIEASKAIQEAGIKVFTITIGGLQFNNKQLINIASSTDDIKILVPGYDDPNLIEEIISIICKVWDIFNLIHLCLKPEKVFKIITFKQ